MKTLKHNRLFVALAFALALASCHKDKVNPNTGNPTATVAGVYVANQGNFGTPNSTLTYYDFASKTLTPDIFKTANNRALGNTANDVKIYGSKMYVVVDVSGTIEVLNAKTAKSIKQVTVQNTDGTTRDPRSITFYKGNAYITLYDGTAGKVAVMDTTTFTISKYISVGRNPEQLTVSNGKIYVANSGGSSFDLDNSVSVIDPTSQAVTKTITVIVNPTTLAADNYGNLYVFSFGDFASVAAGLTVISTTSDAVVSNPKVSLGFSLAAFVQGDNMYYLNASNQVAVYNTKTQTAGASNFVTDGTTLTAPFALSANATTGEVFVTDAKDYSSNGTFYAFDKTGKLEYSFATGISPGAIAFVTK